MAAVLDFGETMLRFTAVCARCNQSWRVDTGSYCGWCSRRMLSPLEWLPSYTSPRVGLRWVSRVVATLQWRKRSAFGHPDVEDRQILAGTREFASYQQFADYTDQFFYEEVAAQIVRGARALRGRPGNSAGPWAARPEIQPALERLAAIVADAADQEAQRNQ